MKIKVGNIFEVNTSKGKAYLHYVNKEDSIGDLVRVLPGLYSERPNDLSLLVASKERYFISFPISFVYKKKLIENVGFYSADTFSKPSFMRTKHSVRGVFLGWQIINTISWNRELVQKLTPEQLGFSPWGIWNYSLLIERLEENWDLKEWN